MAGWIPLNQFLQGLSQEVAKTNVEMQTIQRMAWAESAAYHKRIASQQSSSELDWIRASVLKDWHNENQLAIKEVKLSFVLTERGFFSRLGSLIAHPFSSAPSRYQLIPGQDNNPANNVEITFVQKEDGSWESGISTDTTANDISVPIL